MTILDEILARKKEEIASLPTFDVALQKRRSLVSALKRVHPSLVAEVKPMSPVHGRLIGKEDVPGIVDLYARHAQAISVLCDTATFGGGFELLAFVRSRTDLPLLAKDFIVDQRQIDAAAFHGADAVLLIASLLGQNKLHRLATYATSIGLDVLLELHTSEDVTIVENLLVSLTSAERAHIALGINNRDLHTQTIDLATTTRLAGLLRSRFPDMPIVSESGIGSSDDVRQLAPHVQGFLIGSSVLMSKNPEAFLHALFPRRPKVKLCGMTRSADIDDAEQLSVDFIGLVFAKESPRSVTLAEAKELRRRIKRAKTVGVFTDHSVDNIKKYASELVLDFVQLHGEPDLEKAKKISSPVIQAFRFLPSEAIMRSFLACCEYVLLDGVDFAAVAVLPLDIRSRLFVAGGLTSDNVRSIADRIRPFAVDVARGIESSPGIKDKRRMTAFFQSLL